jgi:alpha-1,2-glucosyltransferase
LPIALLAITNVAATWYRLVSEHVPEPYLVSLKRREMGVLIKLMACRMSSSMYRKLRGIVKATIPGTRRSQHHLDCKYSGPYFGHGFLLISSSYLVSLLFRPFIDSNCDISSLRLVNVGGICLICLAAYDILRTLHRPSPTGKEKQRDQKKASSISPENDQTIFFDANTALNISLFPPLFFFSGLYYTDVISTLLALVSYRAYLKRANGNWKTLDAILAFLLGAAALLFRQTNIFWVAVFPAGLAVVDALKENGAFKYDEAQSNVANILNKSWSEGLVYDINAGSAGLQDYALVIVSVALTAIRKPLVLLRAIAPYLLLLGLFASFVAWNGGVVLGKLDYLTT